MLALLPLVLDVQHLDDDELDERGEHEQHARRHPYIQRLDVRHGGYVLEPGEHGDEREHARDQEGDPPRDGVEAEPEAAPAEEHDEGRGRKRLDQVVADLPLKPEVGDQAGKVAVLFHAVAAHLPELQGCAHVVLQQLESGVDRDAVLTPSQPQLVVVVGEALDVHGAQLDVHRVELELHLAGHDGVHACRVAHRPVAVQRHGGELMREHGDLRHF